MKPKRTRLLAPGEYVVTAWAEAAAGPGWSNAPLWVLVGAPLITQKGYRIECLQPDEQTAAMVTLYGISAQVHESMRASAASLLEGK